MDLISNDWKHIEKFELKLLKNPIIKPCVSPPPPPTPLHFTFYCKIFKITLD